MDGDGVVGGGAQLLPDGWRVGRCVSAGDRRSEGYCRVGGLDERTLLPELGSKKQPCTLWQVLNELPVRYKQKRHQTSLSLIGHSGLASDHDAKILWSRPEAERPQVARSAIGQLASPSGVVASVCRGKFGDPRLL